MRTAWTHQWLYHTTGGRVLRKSFFYLVHVPGVAVKVLLTEGFSPLVAKVRRYADQYYGARRKYAEWIVRSEKYEAGEVREEIGRLRYRPKISVIVPVYNVDPKWLDRCIRSVLDQFYEDWELCICDDASTRSGTKGCLRKWDGADRRIKVHFSETNQHISGASNEALKLATGEFVALLDNDDELAPQALYEVVKLLNEHADADFIYSDEDKIDLSGTRSEPFFKPDWSPDLFLSLMYTSHLGVYRKSLVDQLGGFRKGYEGSQDYDLVLRLIEKTGPEKIFHIPKVLYHWRKIPGSVADSFKSKSYAYVNAKKALADYMARNGIEGSVEDGSFPGSYRIRRRIAGNPKVSIIIPFRDQAEVLKNCVDSILKRTEYDNYELVLVDNQSSEDRTRAYLENIRDNPKAVFLSYDKPFNFSAINNFAVASVESEYVLFLNNDTEVVTGGWLDAMLEHATRPEVGVVGAKLFFPDHTIQHIGVVLGLGIAGHVFKWLPEEVLDLKGYFGMNKVVRDFSAVTGACLLTRRELFNKAGGFDEVNLGIAYNDIDYCLKLRELGYLVVYTPYAELIHYESLSRGYDEELKEKAPEKYKRVMAERDYMARKWDKYIRNDPYYNINLSREKHDFSFAG